MTALDRHAAQIKDTINRRWGLMDHDGVADYLRRSLMDAALDITTETKIPAGEDEADLLARFLAKQNGLDETTNYLDERFEFREKAVRIIDAVEAAGLSLPDLLAFFVEPSP